MDAALTLETTASCPAGFAALMALELLGTRYALRVLPEGHFVAAHGGPGPRLLEPGSAPLQGREVLAELVGRCLARGASTELSAVHARVATGVVPAMLAVLHGAGEAAAAGLRSELTALASLVDALQDSERAAGVTVVVLWPVVRLLQRRPDDAAAHPTLAAALAPLATHPLVVQAAARRQAEPLRSLVSPDEVLTFWFGAPITDAADATVRVRRWFQGGAAMDDEVRARFLSTIEAALTGELDGWARTARGRLALVLVLDQLTRNAFRGSPRTWAGDGRAQALCREALAQGLDAELSWIERQFLRMPLLHAEDTAAQSQSCVLARRAAPEAPPALTRMAEAGVEQAEKYAAIIARFGRFPFRNQVLGRASSDEERIFLAEFEGKRPPQATREARG
jgi:uncharacterized protein (DUF924 family)